jgi:acyl-CoA thioesterase YciA
MNTSPVPAPGGESPDGEIVIRTVAMPSDTNANGDIFGGWLMSQMDLGGSVLARALADSRVVTVAVDAMSFVAPVGVGDTVTCYARHLSTGRTSVKIHLEAWVQAFADGRLRRVTRGVFTYVAIDAAGRARPIARQEQAGGPA